MGGMIYLYVVGTLVALLCIASAIFNWDWFMSRRYGWIPVPVKRAIYLLTGFLLLGVLGARMVGAF
jgi:hypothetical protein